MQNPVRQIRASEFEHARQSGHGLQAACGRKARPGTGRVIPGLSCAPKLSKLVMPAKAGIQAFGFNAMVPHGFRPQPAPDPDPGRERRAVGLSWTPKSTVVERLQSEPLRSLASICGSIKTRRPRAGGDPCLGALLGVDSWSRPVSHSAASLQRSGAPWLGALPLLCR